MNGNIDSDCGHGIRRDSSYPNHINQIPEGLKEETDSRWYGDNQQVFCDAALR